MTSPYNTRSTRSASASSITILPRSDSARAITTTATSQHRHFCIVLTNNPRMIQSAQRMLQNVTLNVPTERGRQEQQHQPAVQMQYLQVPSQTRSGRRPPPPPPSTVNVQVEQQVPMSTQLETTTIMASNMRAYEKEIEADFQAQIQPILQLYLRKTRRPNPINSVFDLSSCVEV